MSNRKKIVIPHRGPIMAKGGIYGPILTPYLEELHLIQALIIGRVKVEEVLSNGMHIPLDLTNYNKDNEMHVVEIPEEVLAGKEVGFSLHALGKEKDENVKDPANPETPSGEQPEGSNEENKQNKEAAPSNPIKGDHEQQNNQNGQRQFNNQRSHGNRPDKRREK